MSWLTLIDAVESGTGRELLAEAAMQDAEVYLYPGSANDLVPLLLGIDDSVFGRRLLQLGRYVEKPLVLWMCEWSIKRPIRDFFNVQSYMNIWDYLGSSFVVTKIQPIELCSPQSYEPLFLTTWIIDVLVASEQGRRNHYRILLTEGDACHLVRYIAHHELRLSWLALIRVGGLANGPTGECVQCVPRAILENVDALGGLPDAIIWDNNGQLPKDFVYHRIFGHEVRDWSWGWVAFHCRPDLYPKYEDADKRCSTSVGKPLLTSTSTD